MMQLLQLKRHFVPSGCGEHQVYMYSLNNPAKQPTVWLAVASCCIVQVLFCQHPNGVSAAACLSLLGEVKHF